MTFALAAVALAAAAGGGADSHRVAVPWTAVGVGPSGRAVAVAFTFGGCQAAPEVSAAQTARTVRISVTVSEPTGRDVVCPAYLAIARRAVRLRAPLAGRRILGQSDRRVPAPPSPSCSGTRVPSVVGMAAADARLALRVQGLRPTGARSGAIVRQRPRAWRCLAGGAAARPPTVRLVAR